MFNEDSVVKSHKDRANQIAIIILASFLLIIIRLWYLQVYKGSEFYKFSLENRLRKETIKASRGLIFSRNNELLVRNTPRFDAVIIPQYLRNSKDTLSNLAKILSVDSSKIKEALRKNRHRPRYHPILVKKNISSKEVAIIETENSKMPGVFVKPFVSRDYVDGEIGAHLLGYISQISSKQLPKYRKRDKFNYKLGDFIGQGGVEEYFDYYLRGVDGHEVVEVDARGRRRRKIKGEIFSELIENRDAISGNNIRLTIDRDLQKTAYNSLEGKIGAVVAVDVNTGEILAMVSRPSFDPSAFGKGIKNYWSKLFNDPNRPMIDRTIQEHYPPASTFKTITALTALEEAIIRPEQEIMCKGSYRLGRRTYNDWKRSGHGMTNVYKSLRRSVDVYYYQLATQLDIDVIAKYAKGLGLGKKTGISLSREIPGLIPSREWKKKRNGEDWQLGETLSCAIGQSYVLVTPLQLAMSYATIANGGTLYRPQLVKEIFDNSGRIMKRSVPQKVSELKVSKKSLDAIKKGLYEVVNHRKGTAWWARGRGLEMAGKTGTGQVRSMIKKELFSKCSDMPYKDRHHGLFVGFAPFDNPKIAVSAVVEHGCSGSGAAAPVVRNVVSTFMKKYYPDVRLKNIEKEKLRRKAKSQ